MIAGKLKLSGKTALVTGGSRGIGLAAARQFLEHGANVAICARDPRRLETARERLSALGDVLSEQVDVTDFEELDAFARAVRERFGAIDVLVNNAGVAWAGAFIEESIASIARTIDVNVKGVLFATRAVLPHMHAAGAGTIINISSGAGLRGHAELTTYCASKFAVMGFTESLAEELAAEGIRVYALCPGRVATDMQEEVSGQRIGIAPKRVAAAVLALAGPRPPVESGGYLEVR